MLRTAEGSTGRLIQLCAGYFVFYVVTGISVKYFLGKASLGLPGMNDIEYLTYSTFSSSLLCIAVVIFKRWYKVESSTFVRVLGRNVPREILYIIPSGVCTAVVVPTTTLMYTLPISVMVAMVIMRGSVIVISRFVDAVQISQGILQKKVYAEENWAVAFAIAAVLVHLGFESAGFDFLGSTAAVTILGSYLVAYTVRIYLMNYFKNTRPKGVRLDNEGFFGVEQISASLTMALVGALVFAGPELFGWSAPQVLAFHESIANPHADWLWAMITGSAFGVVAFFSVFIFMFKGRTATFAGLVNRLTSLVAGTTATLNFAVFFGGKMPKVQDWISLGFILIAVAFLTRAEKRRTVELAAAPAT